MVVYPSSATFPTLNSDFFKLGKISTFFAAMGKLTFGNSALSDPLMMLPLGRYTCLVDGSPM